MKQLMIFIIILIIFALILFLISTSANWEKYVCCDKKKTSTTNHCCAKIDSIFGKDCQTKYGYSIYEWDEKGNPVKVLENNCQSGTQPIAAHDGSKTSFCTPPNETKWALGNTITDVGDTSQQAKYGIIGYNSTGAKCRAIPKIYEGAVKPDYDSLEKCETSNPNTFGTSFCDEEGNLINNICNPQHYPHPACVKNKDGEYMGICKNNDGKSGCFDNDPNHCIVKGFSCIENNCRSVSVGDKDRQPQYETIEECMKECGNCPTNKRIGPYCTLPYIPNTRWGYCYAHHMDDKHSKDSNPIIVNKCSADFPIAYTPSTPDWTRCTCLNNSDRDNYGIGNQAKADKYVWGYRCVEDKVHAKNKFCEPVTNDSDKDRPKGIDYSTIGECQSKCK